MCDQLAEIRWSSISELLRCGSRLLWWGVIGFWPVVTRHGRNYWTLWLEREQAGVGINYMEIEGGRIWIHESRNTYKKIRAFLRAGFLRGILGHLVMMNWYCCLLEQQRWSTQFACGIVTAFENQQTRVWELTRGKASWLKRGSLAFFCFSASSPISGRILQETYRRQPSAFQLLCLLRCYHRSQVKLLTRRWVIWWDSRGLPSLLTLGGWQDWSTFVLALGLRTSSHKLKSPPSPLFQRFPGPLTSFPFPNCSGHSSRY